MLPIPPDNPALSDSEFLEKHKPLDFFAKQGFESVGTECSSAAALAVRSEYGRQAHIVVYLRADEFVREERTRSGTNVKFVLLTRRLLETYVEDALQELLRQEPEARTAAFPPRRGLLPGRMMVQPGESSPPDAWDAEQCAPELPTDLPSLRRALLDLPLDDIPAYRVLLRMQRGETLRGNDKRIAFAFSAYPSQRAMGFSYFTKRHVGMFVVECKFRNTIDIGAVPRNVGLSHDGTPKDVIVIDVLIHELPLAVVDEERKR